MNKLEIFMLKNVLIFLCVILLSSCNQSKWGMVKDFNDATNSYDKKDISTFLVDSFKYCGEDTLNKEEYLARIDSLKTIEYFSTLLKCQEINGIVKTEEKVSSIIDSLLEVKPNIIQRKTYSFLNNKLVSITVDSTLNYDEHMNALNERTGAFSFFLKDQYDIEDEEEFTNNLKKYITEYTSLPASERRTYRTYANLQGTYVSKNCTIYRKLVFRGKKTATIIDAIFGFHFTSSYEIDENYVRIKTDKSDLLFEIKDSKTLIGEGFAKGTFTKSN